MGVLGGWRCVPERPRTCAWGIKRPARRATAGHHVWSADQPPRAHHHRRRGRVPIEPSGRGRLDRDRRRWCVPDIRADTTRRLRRHRLNHCRGRRHMPPQPAPHQERRQRQPANPKPPRLTPRTRRHHPIRPPHQPGRTTFRRPAPADELHQTDHHGQHHRRQQHRHQDHQREPRLPNHDAALPCPRRDTAGATTAATARTCEADGPCDGFTRSHDSSADSGPRRSPAITRPPQQDPRAAARRTARPARGPWRSRSSA
jgi:hypothetical protein